MHEGFLKGFTCTCICMYMCILVYMLDLGVHCTFSLLMMLHTMHFVQAVVRVHFPDLWVLQGSFRPRESCKLTHRQVVMVLIQPLCLLVRSLSLLCSCFRSESPGALYSRKPCRCSDQVSSLWVSSSQKQLSSIYYLLLQSIMVYYYILNLLSACADTTPPKEVLRNGKLTFAEVHYIMMCGCTRHCWYDIHKLKVQ